MATIDKREVPFTLAKEQTSGSSLSHFIYYVSSALDCSLLCQNRLVPGRGGSGRGNKAAAKQHLFVLIEEAASGEEATSKEVNKQRKTSVFLVRIIDP